MELLLVGLAMWCIITALQMLMCPVNVDLKTSAAFVNRSIDRIALTSNGEELWIQRGRRSILAFDVTSGRVHSIFERKDNPIHQWDVSRDGNTMLLSTDGSHLIVTRHHEPIVNEKLPFQTSLLTALSGDGQRAVRISGGTKVRSWDLSAAIPCHLDFTSPRTAEFIAINPTGSQLALTTPEDEIFIYSLSDGRLIQTLADAGNQSMAPVFSHDGRWLASIQGPSLTIYDIQSGMTVQKTIDNRRIEGNSELFDHLTSAAFSPDGTLIAVAGLWSSIRIFEVKSGDCRHENKFGSVQYRVCFSLSGNRVYCAAADGSVVEWNFAKRTTRKIEVNGKSPTTPSTN